MAKTKPKKIDIIIPAYNAHETLTRALASILMQTVVDDCVVTIVNDGQFDVNYDKIIKPFQKLMYVREIMNPENGGPGVARQFGIDNTSCPYVTMMDADDTWASAFSLNRLSEALESDPKNIAAMGCFVEEKENGEIVGHKKDLVWMFGKLYKRSHFQKYDIRFNETRANEDSGFNKKVWLCMDGNEQINYIDDIVYFWHFKPDSITRINNYQYTYDQSYIGVADNMMHSIKHARKKQPFNPQIVQFSISFFAQLYTYYLKTVKRDNRFAEQNFNKAREYYKEIIKPLFKDYTLEHMYPIFANALHEQAQGMPDIVPEITLFQFMDIFDKLDEDEAKEQENIQENIQEEKGDKSLPLEICKKV